LIFLFSLIAFGEQWLVALEIEDQEVSELNWSQMKAMSQKKSSITLQERKFYF